MLEEVSNYNYQSCEICNANECDVDLNKNTENLLNNRNICETMQKTLENNDERKRFVPNSGSSLPIVLVGNIKTRRK